MKYLVVLLLVITAVCAARAETYYISPLGNDISNNGKTRNRAWASISKVNNTAFLPGDSILFEGGRTFEGSLFFTSTVRGTAAQPIYIGSYGQGRAMISSGSSPGLKVYNTAGYKVQNLLFRGAGRTSNTGSGIDFFMDMVNTRLNYIAIDKVEVYGYRLAGIHIGSWRGSSGYDNVSVTNSTSHDNGDGGIATYAEAVLGHRNVYIGYNKVYNNAGLPEKKDLYSGNGIVISGVDGAIIEHCEAYNNGWLNAWTAGGPVGIWGYHCNNLVIQFNESHHNRTGTTKDGGGFDIDGGCTNSILQYNYSHDNEGAGFLIAQYRGAPAMRGITVRYNISENDGRRNGYGAIHIWSSGASGGIRDLDIYNNTVYLSPASNGLPKAICIESGGRTDATVRNNIFQTTGGLEVVNAQTVANLRFEGNNYWSTGSSLKINWAGKTYASLPDWRKETTQEVLQGTAVGHALAPGLKSPGLGVTVAEPGMLRTLTGYELQQTSNLIANGLNLKTLFNLDAGEIDFFGYSLYGLEQFSVGAHQPSLVPLPVAFTSFRVYRKGPFMELAWETASELNNKGFEVEVATDGKLFEAIGFVESNTTNSVVRQSYRFTDTQTAAETRYYRLRQVDLDGTADYSTVIAVQAAEPKTGLTLYPNPFRNWFVLEINVPAADDLYVTLTDITGREVMRETTTLQQGHNLVSFYTGTDLPEGLYLVTATYAGETHQLKVIRK